MKDVDYSQRISARVRELRAVQGLSRRALSQRSDVSERYLASVESGEANLSISLLQQIARALGTDLLDLLSPQPERQLSRYLAALETTQQQQALALLKERFGERRSLRGVALIGLRGAGKTTLGSRLAAARDKRFIQVTDTIESLGRMPVAEIFSLGGQSLYRRLELQAVQTLIEDVPAPLVVETGGSLVTSDASYGLIRSNFWTVWIKASPESHMTRVIAQGDLRPMTGHDDAMQDLRNILQEREFNHRRADYVLDTTDRNIDECVDELAAATADSLMSV